MAQGPPHSVHPLRRGPLFTDTVDGKLLRNRFFPAAPEEDRSALFLRAASQGFAGKQILLCAALPGLRLESRRFPDMTKEELAETMRWESDRIFRTDAPLSMDWTATAHEPDRWDILAAACTEEELRRWTEPAGQAGRRIVCAAVPSPKRKRNASSLSARRISCCSVSPTAGRKKALCAGGERILPAVSCGPAPPVFSRARCRLLRRSLGSAHGCGISSAFVP